MQILLTREAHDLVGERLGALGPHIEPVIVAAPDMYEINGRAVALTAVEPEIAWLSLDSLPSGLLPTLVKGVLRGGKARWAQGFSAGLNNPAYPQMMRAGIRITRSSAQAVSIAEYVVAQALSLLIPLDEQKRAQKERAWRPTPFRQVEGSHWLLVGYGAIGKAVAKRIRAFGVQVSVVKRTAGGGDSDIHAYQLNDIGQILPQADVVVLACPLTEETLHLANGAFFSAMKPGCVLINVGRGGLVEEDAMRSGMARDQPAFAVLDVFETEPLPPDAWLWGHPQVRVTAHTSYNGDGNLRRSADAFLENLGRYLAGEALLDEAKPYETALTVETVANVLATQR